MNKVIEREQWKQMIIDHGPYKYMITVTFKHSLSDNEAIQVYNRLLRFVNRKIYGNRSMEKNRHMTGFVSAERQQRRLTKQEKMLNKFKANNIEFIKEHGDKVAEQTKRSFNKDATLHFHMLVKDDLFLSRFSAVELRQLILEQCDKLKKQSAKGYDYDLFDERGIDIRSVYDITELADYLTKETKTVGGDNISSLNKYGVEFISEELKQAV